MKWILLLMLSLCSFLVQAGNCELVSRNTVIESKYSLNPSQYTGTISLGNIGGTTPVIHCPSTQNAELHVSVEQATDSVYYFDLGGKYYSITFFAPSTTLSKIKPNEFNTLPKLLSNTELKYRIQEVSSTNGAELIKLNTPFPLTYSMTVREYQTSSKGYKGDTLRVNYIINITLEVRIMTCGFKDQVIDMGVYPIEYILKGNTEYELKQIDFRCTSQGYGTLMLTPSEVQYYFDDSFGRDSDTAALKNTLAGNSGSAGDVGFEIATENESLIKFGSNALFKLSPVAGQDIPVKLSIRPKAYGTNVTSGNIESKVRVVVVYN